MDLQITADPTPAPPPTLPHQGVPVDAGLGRFSPVSAPQRETVDIFLRETRPWALRQARRSYRHLPESLHEQAVDRACTEMRTRAPQSLERRALAAELAERLTEALRHVHVGWCLNESSALLRREGTEPVQPEVRCDGLANFVDVGLGGLERAVLQLEIGAGRDTRTSRAALRLGPRQYATHRESGLSKLRDAISAQVIGRACDQHVSGIVAAATGDKGAMEALNAGPHRCRYCAREAQGLRSVLRERLAVAPWPIVVKPAGLLAAKLGVVGAAFGSKGAGAGAGALGVAGGSGASAAATVLAAAALATGTADIVDGGESKREGSAERVTQAGQRSTAAKAQTRRKASGGAKASVVGVKAAPKAGGRRARVRPVTDTGAAAPTSATATLADTAPETTQAASGPATRSPATEPVTAVTKPVTDTVEQVTDVTAPVVDDTLDDTVEQVTGTVDEATGVVDDLLP